VVKEVLPKVLKLFKPAEGSKALSREEKEELMKV